MVGLGLRSIFFSIDGSGPNIDDTIRGKGVFNKSLTTMQKFLAERKIQNSPLKVNVNTVLTKINASDIPAIINLCSSNGVDGFKLSHLDLIGNAAFNSDSLFLKPIEEFKVVEEVMKIIPNYPELKFSILSSKPKFLEYVYKKYNVSFPVDVTGCKACIREIYIDPAGNTAPCLSTYEEFGNKLNDKIKNYKVNIFESNTPLCEYAFYNEFKNNFPLIKETYQNYVPCNSCPYLTTLCYPCPLGSSDSIHVDEFCSIAEEKLSEMERGE